MSQQSDNSRDRQRIEPAAFSAPGSGQRAARKSAALRPLPLGLAALLLVLLAALWFVLTAQSIQVEVTPTPASLSVSGGLVVPLGGHYLLRPGGYRVHAHKPGYQMLDKPITVADDSNKPFTFTLDKLPGRLRVTSTPAGAAVTIDGQARGDTPLDAVKLSPGEHQITLRAPRYQVAEKTITIAGADKLQTLALELTPAWAKIDFSSKPAGAAILVDGKQRGTTPATVEIGAGAHQVALTLDGYQRWQQDLQVVADKPQTLSTVTLAKTVGRLRVTSSPAGATVSTGGSVAGRTPVTLKLAPGSAHAIRIAKAGYKTEHRSARVASGKQAALAVTLAPIKGQVRVTAEPADAQVLVDGHERGAAGQTFNLLAVAHQIEVRKSGYAPYKTTVTPKPGLTQRVNARLLTREQARYASLPRTLTTAAGQRLRLIKPGSFTMGAPRREQGRRANEAQHPVKLTRAYYLGEREVTNAQYRQFKSSYSSGIVARTTLDNDDQPVVRVSWADATAYCNWLSKRDGLTPAYSGGKLITPVATGYRLPTEAEWAWAARFAGGRHLKYAWGPAMPPRGNAGNYADVSAAALLREHLDGYNDGYPAAAPVGQFAASALGLYDMGGNVSEWMTDVYTGGVTISSKVEVDPIGTGSGSSHAVRGASWRDASITTLRLSHRGASAEARDDLGFRIARYAK